MRSPTPRRSSVWSEDRLSIVDSSSFLHLPTITIFLKWLLLQSTDNFRPKYFPSNRSLSSARLIPTQSFVQIEQELYNELILLTNRLPDCHVEAGTQNVLFCSSLIRFDAVFVPLRSGIEGLSPSAVHPWQYSACGSLLVVDVTPTSSVSLNPPPSLYISTIRSLVSTLAQDPRLPVTVICKEGIYQLQCTICPKNSFLDNNLLNSELYYEIPASNQYLYASINESDW